MKHNDQQNDQELRPVIDAMNTLADDARALMAATVDVAGEKVGEARQRVAAALERGQEAYGRVRRRAVEGARVADKAVHEHAYPAIAIGFGLGAIVGILIARRGSRNGD